MYTQCPHCHTAFRVTAQVLQQASGRVRCGGCGDAFNALDFLSEDLPADREEPSASDPAANLDLEKKKLLETLDQLAGPENVIIEDTGAEWQVLDESAGDDAAMDTGDTASMRWIIEEAKDDAEGVPEIVDKVPLADGDDASSRERVMRFDDNTPLPEDYEDIVTVSPPPQRRQDDKLVHETAHFDELQFDLALGDAKEWGDLLEEVEDDEDTGESPIPLEVEEELAAIHSEMTARPPNRDSKSAASAIPPDLDTQFDSQAEAMGLDLTGSGKIETLAEDDEQGSSAETVLASDDDDDGELRDTAARLLESTSAFEKQIAVARAALAGPEADEQAETDEESGEYRLSLEDESDAESTEPDEDDIAELVLRGGLAAAEITAGDDGELTLSNDAAEAADEKPPAGKFQYPGHLFDEYADNVETIIMEGEFVRGSLEEDLAAESGPQQSIDESAFLADTYSNSRKKIRGGRRKSDPPGAGVIAAAIVLAVLFAGQLAHNMRQSLSTIGAFNQTIAPIYRLLGQPITPAWDIKGWQFQATRGATDENGELLTIYSTVVNRSAGPLPYPLVHVSLTDRWEEIIGSRALEPNEYLAGDLDPSKPVAAGDSFTAVISISSPSADATGFKLNVCYRAAPGQVRCATEDFRD